jgi:GAF domain-containing protein
MLARVVQGAVYLCRAEQGALYLADPDSGALHMTAAQSQGKRAAQGLRLPIVDRVADHVLRRGTSVLVTNQVLSAHLREQAGGAVYSLLSVPLKTRGKSIGVLCVVNRSRQLDFVRDDTDRLRAVANYAAVAVENGRLLEATRKTAVAEMLDQTVATVAHYINTPLMALMVKTDGLVLAKERGALVEVNAEGDVSAVDEMARFTETKVQEIKAVLAILSDLAAPQIVTDMDDVEMLDIDARVRERLRQIRARYQA